MLDLIGRVADGWLPSLPYLQGGAARLADLNAMIDEGAAAAGRDPRSVRRLLNITGEFTRSGSGLLVGPASQWAAELASLALDFGISGFIMLGDDPAAIQRFGQDVAPAVRELVAAGRADPADRADPIAPDSAPFSARPAAEVSNGPPESRIWNGADRPVGGFTQGIVVRGADWPLSGLD